MLASQEGFDSEELQRDMSYFVLPSSREYRVCLRRRAVNFWGSIAVSCCHASYGRPSAAS